MARLIPIRSEPKCATCKSANRTSIDSWIARLGETDGKGRTVTWDLLCTEVVPVLLGQASIAQSSLKRHRAGHCRLVEDGTPEAKAADVATDEADAATQELLAEIRRIGGADRVSPTELLNLQLRLHLLDLERKVLSGEHVPITPDQAARAAKLMQDGEKTHEQSVLLGALGGAIGSVFEHVLRGSDDNEQPALIDGEVLAIEEAVIAA